MLFQSDPGQFFPVKKKKSNDYANAGPMHLDDEKNFTLDSNEHFTQDKEEQKWDYFREDPLLHVSHSTLHQARHDQIFILLTLHPILAV